MNPPWRQRMRVEKQSRYAFFILSLLSDRADAEMQQASLSLGPCDHAALQPWPAPTASHNRKTVGTSEVRGILPEVWQEEPVVWCATLWHTHIIAFHSFASTPFPPPPKCINRACQHPSCYTGISCDDSNDSISHHSHIGWSDSLSNFCFLVKWFMFLNVFLLFTINTVSHKVSYKANWNIFIEHFKCICCHVPSAQTVPSLNSTECPTVCSPPVPEKGQRQEFTCQSQTGNYVSSKASIKKAGDLQKVLTSFLCFSRSLIFFSYTSGSQVLDGVFSTALPDCKLKTYNNNDNLKNYFNYVFAANYQYLNAKSTLKC